MTDDTERRARQARDIFDTVYNCVDRDGEIDAFDQAKAIKYIAAALREAYQQGVEDERTEATRC
jgi:hypothetical protein